MGCFQAHLLNYDIIEKNYSIYKRTHIIYLTTWTKFSATFWLHFQVMRSTKDKTLFLAPPTVNGREWCQLVMVSHIHVFLTFPKTYFSHKCRISAKKCPVPIAPMHGTVIDAGVRLTYGNEIRYKCADGYKLVGNERGRCNENNNWGQVPTCVGEY